jgi:hypothetical protein
MASFWDWLVSQGLYHDIVNLCLLFIFGPILAYHPWKKHRESQKEIANALDTRTPGGLADVVRAVREQDSGVGHGS